MKKLFLVLLTVLIGCSSAEIVENWKNPDIVTFNANKVLLVGITNDKEARSYFESQLQKEFKNRKIEAVQSLDVFDVNFIDSTRTEKELDAFEKSLLDKDFDAILLTKIVSSENRTPLIKSIDNLYNSRDVFNENYRRHQNIYYDEEHSDTYTVYNAETSLYWLCVEKERSLIWRFSIDIFDPYNDKKNIKEYVQFIVQAMEEQDLIFHKTNSNEVTGI